jgi:hypothetical protein
MHETQTNNQHTGVLTITITTAISHTLVVTTLALLDRGGDDDDDGDGGSGGDGLQLDPELITFDQSGKGFLHPFTTVRFTGQQIELDIVAGTLDMWRIFDIVQSSASEWSALVCAGILHGKDRSIGKSEDGERLFVEFDFDALLDRKRRERACKVEAIGIRFGW